MAGTQTIGIVGGGQLARMLTLAAAPLGFRVIVLDPKPGSPAAQVGAAEITADLYDAAALRRLAERADYLTIEIEHLNAQALAAIAALGKPVNPAPQTIELIQDKLRQKEFLARNTIAIAPFADVKDLAGAKKAWQHFGRKMFLKTRHGAYDGRGNMLIQSEQDIQQAFDRFAGQALYAEQFVPFKKELAVMVARNISGEVRVYPIVETIHKRNICVEVRAPAEITAAERKRAEKLAFEAAGHLPGAGVFGIEMFLTNGGKVLINEIAPRVHNSGHYTTEACHTSQFEQHIRAITGLPLGDTSLVVPAAVMVNILGERDAPTEIAGLDDALALPQVSVHLYGKSPTKIDRKMGHITATGATVAQAKRRATSARRKISI
ncbi:MAG TPA: 5-(carboxyamino)imidazole ribonucleotide synthase [Candidatus Saccharimonadales bacterium]|jgi:phosphoribosylaminoimidazole carboxylase PurK protein|nr:5-(carboxyamino)imidazole ribonucleotide synthase [Candidatus Saccharimonadales bacterium]